MQYDAHLRSAGLDVPSALLPVCLPVCLPACLPSQLHGPAASIPVATFDVSSSAGATQNLSSLVSAAPTQMHLKLELGFPAAAQHAAVSVDLLGGQTNGGCVCVLCGTPWCALCGF
jgi:hypothetical protein